MCEEWPRVSYGQRALKGQIFKSVIAFCRQKAPSSNTVFKCVRSVRCGNETVQWVLVLESQRENTQKHKHNKKNRKGNIKCPIYKINAN